MSVAVPCADRYIPPCTIPAALHRLVLLEARNVMDNPERVEDVALWFGGADVCRFIAKNDGEFNWGTYGAAHLMGRTDTNMFDDDVYVFVTVLHEEEWYCAWVKQDDEQIVTIHRNDCDLLQDLEVLAEVHEDFDGGKKHEGWLERGNTLFYSLDICESSDSAAVAERIATVTSGLDTLSMSSQEIADCVNADLEALDEHLSSLEVEPNYELICMSPSDVRDRNVCIWYSYHSRRVTAEEVFDKVKKPQYLQAGIDVDLAAALEGFESTYQQSKRLRGRRRRLPRKNSRALSQP